MKNIHLFETKNAYDAAKNELILPTVSYVKEKKDVNYFPVRPYVEIAGIKWATMNVGANSITDTGLYFQWGDTQGYTADEVGTGEGKKKFASDGSDYKWYDTKTSAFTKYNSSGETLALEDDAVRANWGGSWRMPTADEFQALGKAVTTKFVKNYNNSGVNGMLCTAKEDSSKALFFPACESIIDGGLSNLNFHGCYLSSSIFKNVISLSCALDFLELFIFIVKWNNSDNRFNGYTVRGVLDEK